MVDDDYVDNDDEYHKKLWPLIIEAGRLQVQQPKTRICKQLSLSAYKKTKKKRESSSATAAALCV
ncbi:hypothetical protein OUZ56_030987 [Daphnia magna]|uniref:Uncharacterized protein n=1 Tax=Daphnia magna TaxID=35525 RepID=A0ABQ9ZSW6_9CRUS|nr:hypothetical protein OUZ56_030987 [Daphnia magna]